MAIKKTAAENAKKLKGKTDWSEVDSLSDKGVEEAAKDDPGSALPTDEELKEFKQKTQKKRSAAP